jgi:hypothetical protein
MFVDVNNEGREGKMSLLVVKSLREWLGFRLNQALYNAVLI